MSRIALASNASGTGVFTFESPNSNSNRTLSLPDASGTLSTQEYIPTALNASGSAPIYAARAWVNFNGTGTVAIRASGNVSSITDNGTGDYTVNFTTAMPDANFSALASASANNNAPGSSIAVYDVIVNNTATGSVRIGTTNAAGTLLDFLNLYVTIFR
jgi:hypothetical protein